MSDAALPMIPEQIPGLGGKEDRPRLNQGADLTSYRLTPVEGFVLSRVDGVLVHSAEQGAYEWGNGVWFPDGRPFRALRPLLPLWFPRVNEIIRLLGSHNLLAAPTSAQLADPSLRPLIDRFLRGAKDVTAEQRARIFRLAWDFVGSALASRGEQYERFYLASSGRAFIRAQTFASPDRARRLIDRFLSEELVPGA